MRYGRVRVVNLTGAAASVTSIIADKTQMGDIVVLVSDGTAAQQVTDGSNLQLAGNWTPNSAGDTLTICCYDGTNWAEISRANS